jgi:pimeloyl-ACP methyl ester carboxylesterase
VTSPTLHLHRWGTGPRVVLVHGAVLGGREAWRGQRPLTERWELVAPDRPGHGRTPWARQDFEPESVLLADQLLDPPCHLVGMSYGGIVAMLAAAHKPAGVRSLTVIEPPSTAVARGVPAVDVYGAAMRDLSMTTDVPLEEALMRFLAVVGAPVTVPRPVPPALLDGVRQILGARPPDEAELPLDTLRQAGFPMLVVSGGHMPANEIICDVIAERTGAQRAVCPGAGHLVPDTGAPFNAVLEDFLTAAG